MTRASHSLRLFLIFVLCTGGAVSAWASTRMAAISAVRAMSSSAQAGTEAPRDCEEDGVRDSGQKSGEEGSQHGCDCGSGCSCVLTFFAGDTDVLFAAQHKLASIYSGTLTTHPVRNDISPVFRPPIG